MDHTHGPNCWDCRYLRITWNPNRPYACDFMGFESRWIPSIEVIRADGRPCGAFVPKARGKSSEPAADPKAGGAVESTSVRQQSVRPRLKFGINVIT